MKAELEKYGFEKRKMNIMRKADLIDLLQSEIQKEEKRQDSYSLADLSSAFEEKGSIASSGGVSRWRGVMLQSFAGGEFNVPRIAVRGLLAHQSLSLHSCRHSHGMQ